MNFHKQESQPDMVHNKDKLTLLQKTNTVATFEDIELGPKLIEKVKTLKNLRGGAIQDHLFFFNKKKERKIKAKQIEESLKSNLESNIFYGDRIEEAAQSPKMKSRSKTRLGTQLGSKIKSILEREEIRELDDEASELVKAVKDGKKLYIDMFSGVYTKIKAANDYHDILRDTSYLTEYPEDEKKLREEDYVHLKFEIKKKKMEEESLSEYLNSTKKDLSQDESSKIENLPKLNDKNSMIQSSNSRDNNFGNKQVLNAILKKIYVERPTLETKEGTKPLSAGKIGPSTTVQGNISATKKFSGPLVKKRSLSPRTLGKIENPGYLQRIESGQQKILQQSEKTLSKEYYQKLKVDLKKILESYNKDPTGRIKRKNSRILL